MVSLEKTPHYQFNCEKGLHQEGYPAVKLCLKRERIYVMSKIVERNNQTGTLCEGVVNGRTDFQVGPPIRSMLCKIIQARLKLCIESVNVGTMHGKASEVVETLAKRRIEKENLFYPRNTLERLHNTNDYW